MLINTRPQIVILTYMNRSGSTYLANLLDQYKDIGVSIEAEIPNGLNNKPSPFRKIIKHFHRFKIDSLSSLDNYLEQLFSVTKFLKWNIDKEDLRNRLINCKFPLSFDDILHNIFALYFKDREESKCIIFKNMSYIHYVEYIKRTIPNVKFIHIIRDPRAIYNSQRKTISPKKKRPMAISSIYTAKSFNKICKILDKYHNDPNFYVLRYEDLIYKQDMTLNKILNFLNVQSEKKNTDYFTKVPEEQKKLHVNIDSPPLSTRVQAWQSELPKHDIYFIQKLSQKFLNKYNYHIEHIKDINITSIIYWYINSKYNTLKVFKRRCFYWISFYFKKYILKKYSDI